MSRHGHLEPSAGVVAYDRQERAVDLEALRGRLVKKTCRKPDGSVVAVIDQGAGLEGLPVRFLTGEDYEKCRRRPVK